MQCIPAPIGEIRYAYIVDHGDEASQSKPAQALSHLLNVVMVAIEVADRFYGNHGTLFIPFRMVRSAWCFPSRTCTVRRNLWRCIWKFRGRGSSMNQWTSSRNPLGGNQALNPASRQHEANTRKHSRQALWAHGKDHLPEHLHGPLSKRTMGGIRRKSCCRKTRSRGLPASGSCPLHFGEPSTNKWTWMLWSSAIDTSRNARTTSIAEQYSRTRASRSWRIPTFWSPTTMSSGVSLPPMASDLANASLMYLLALTQTSIMSTESWSSQPCW